MGIFKLLFQYPKVGYRSEQKTWWATILSIAVTVYGASQGYDTETIAVLAGGVIGPLVAGHVRSAAEHKHGTVKALIAAENGGS